MPDPRYYCSLAALREMLDYPDGILTETQKANIRLEILDREAPTTEEAFRAGWESSGEGFNGEYPDEGVSWESSAGHAAYTRWVDRNYTQ